MVIVNLRNWWLSSAMMAAIMKTALILSRSFHLLFCLCPRPRNSLLSYFFFSYWLFKAKAKAFKSDAADTRWRSCVTWFKRGKICNPVASTKGGKICYHRLFVATDVHHAGKRACHLNSFLVDEITKLGNCVSPGPVNLVSLCVAWLGKRIFSLESLTEENITHVYLTRPVGQVLVEILYCSRIFFTRGFTRGWKVWNRKRGKSYVRDHLFPPKNSKSVLTV